MKPVKHFYLPAGLPAIIFCTLLVNLLCVVPCAGADGGVSAVLPRAGEVGDFKPSGSPQEAEGDDLFLLINGGAEIYHEYGFKHAVIQGYKNSRGQSFNMEIYRMNDPGSAFGVFTFKASKTGRRLDIGNDAVLDDYYINYWKGEYLVTVIGFDNKKETLDIITKAARAAASKIKTTGTRPALVNLLPSNNRFKPKTNGIKYLKGQLALYNHYPFDPDNIFGIGEGVAADYGGFEIFVFSYETPDEAGKYLKAAIKRLGSSPRFRAAKPAKAGTLSITDKKGKSFFLEQRGKYILIVGGKNLESGKKLIHQFSISST